MTNFKFNKNSGCVKVWVSLILNGTYTYDQVPPLLNLQECVKAVLEDVGFKEDKDKEKHNEHTA
ncbi:hypothetical protein G8S55_06780 [Clostridium botulinum C]|nr:hypothetical protein [Clostridium botulinum]MCD3216957.1 hypothetical protein [Clostridium botulinum C]